MKIKLLIPLIEYLVKFVYQYNFLILKNEQYKKIVVAFPGITTYFQIIEELIHEGMIELNIKSNNKLFYVMEMYYNIFNRIETELFENLADLSGINDQNYQVIFIGHSLGGAIATISSFYYVKKYKFKAENILITFGQPRVGSEIFSKELTNNLGQIYRIARKNDEATLFPFKGIDFIFKILKTCKLFWDTVKFLITIGTRQIITAGISFINFIRNIKDFVEEYSYFAKDRLMEDYLYTYTGGLYMIDDNTNKVYHCHDFYNEKREHFICKNHNIKFSLSFFSDFFTYRNYLSLNQNMLNSCQKKKLEFFKFSVAALENSLR